MNKNDLLIYNVNPQPVPSTYNYGYSQYETSLKLIDFVNSLISNQNLGSDEIADLQNKKVSLEYYLDDLKNKRKLDENGNFTGTLNGLPMSFSNEGLATDWNSAKGSFSTVSGRLGDIDSRFNSINQYISNTDVILADYERRISALGTIILNVVSGEDITSKLQLAINSLSNGGKIVIPNGTFNFNKITIPYDNICLQLSEKTILNHLTWNENGIEIGGSNCVIKGGKINGGSTFDGTNVAWTYAVIYISGNRCIVSDLYLENVPKVGIGIREVDDITINRCYIIGNYPSSQWSGVQTAHYGISFDPSSTPTNGNIIISNNIIKKCVQGCFIGNYGVGDGYGINIIGNVFEGCLNHGIYCNGGYGNIISNNSFNRCSLPIALWGKYSIVSYNTMYTYASGDNNDLCGISVREGSHCIVTGNIIKGDAPIGSVIIDVTNIQSSTIDSNIISDNIIDCINGSSIAIRIGNTTVTQINTDNTVKGNKIKVLGRLNNGVITVLITNPYMGKRNKIIDNDIVVLNNTNAIYCLNQSNMDIRGNTIRLEYNALASETINLIQSSTVLDSLIANNMIVCETGFGTNVTLRGFVDTSTSLRNLITGNVISLTSTNLVAKTEIIIQASSKSSNNMLGGTYTA